MMYNMADCTINISDAEGFGLATLESLSCGTPIIVTLTGGLQEQVTDGEEWFGIGIEPASKAIIGSLDVPYIHEDRISKEDFMAALRKMYNMPKEEREELGRKGAEHVRKNYNFEDFNKGWVELMDNIHEKYGSWGTRKGYKTWEIKEIA
jgi:glycosyltransferase involved in cell wall biosynthesis